jgi:hypothetical protein
MTVKELIEELKSFPEDAVVIVEDNCGVDLGEAEYLSSSNGELRITLDECKYND